MPRTLVSIALAAVAAFGSAAVANSMQGPRTGNPPGPERPMHAQEAQSGHMGQGSMMMRQERDMMGNRQMPAPMDRMMESCRCCERMAQKERKPSELR
jgi:hypothetical protein